MFKGIVEGTGRVLKVAPLRGGSRLRIQSPFALKDLEKGDSIAVNGCCLTVVGKSERTFEAELSHETLRVTNLKGVHVGSLVNLERPLRLADRIDGHLVQGHVDGVGRIRSVKKPGGSWEIEVSFPKALRRYLIPKGSVAVDGISMTVNRLTPRSFTLAVIPHTFQATNLKAKRAGDPVNLEVDMVGKYLESLSRYGGKKA
ncbi:MAG TPA: riboflavin synthase [bacterium]|nr:riboflavin synthase [bacterium]